MVYNPYSGRGPGGYGRPGGQGGPVNFFGPLTPTVMYLIIANVAAFVVSVFMPRPDPFSPDYFTSLIALIPARVVPGLEIWRLGTYLFAHGDFSHLLFNMLTLWWFGGPLEQVFGRDRFLKYYFLCGVGAGVVCVPFYYLTGDAGVPVVGASGALFGLLMGFALLYPNARVYLYFLLPIRVRYLVIFWAFMELAATASYVSGGRSAVASIAHLSGLAIGYFYLRGLTDFRSYYQRLKNRRKPRAYRVVPGDDERGRWLH